MTYLLPKNWADTPTALEIINAVGAVVPVVGNMKIEIPLLYTNYWCLFYAVFWIISPLYVVLGVLSSFFISPVLYEKIMKMSIWRVVIEFLLFLAPLGLAFVLPLLTFGPLVQQMSHVLWLLLISWVLTASMLYISARTFRILLMKLIKLHKQKIET